jgi:hypothetical protein
VKKHTLLICTIPAMRPVLVDALNVRFNLAFCYTLREAVSLLDTGVDAVVCGIYFADGQVFDLLRLVKANPKTKHIPFFTAYGSPDELMTGVEQGIETATRALGGEGFIPLTRWRSESGDDKAFEKVRNRLDKALKDRAAKSGEEASVRAPVRGGPI